MMSLLLVISTYFSEKQKRLIKEIISIVIVISVTVFLYSFLFKIPSTAVVGDAQRYNGYQAYIVKYSLTHFGQLGLWDQFLSSGMSWISHPGGGQFSPFALLAILITDDITKGSLLIFFIPTLTAALAYYFLFRVIGLSKMTGLLISLLAISNQYIFMFVANGWFEEFLGLTLIPVTVGLLWLSFTRRNSIYAMIAGVVMSLNFFSNSYYVFHYNAIVMLWIGGIFVLREIWLKFKKKSKEINILKSYVLSNALFWLVLIGISAIKLIPLLEFRSISARNTFPLHMIETPDGVMSFSFFYSLFKNFVIPAGHTDSFTHYANNLSIMFILISILYFLFRKSFRYGVFIGLFILGIWGYFAYRIPFDLYAFFYKFLPGFNSNIYPYRFMIIINFAFLVLVALGLDVLNRQKNKAFLVLGSFLGTVIVLGSITYSFISYNSLSYPKVIDVKNDLKNSKFTIQKPDDFSLPPKIQGNISKNLVTDLARIIKSYGSEGRVYSNFSLANNSNALVNSIMLEENIPVVHHSYNPIVPTYEYDIIPLSNKDSLEQTINRFKILSVLNTRFQFQQKEYFDYNCPRIGLISTTLTTKNEICSYFDNRLFIIAANSSGEILYDKSVLPKVTMISNSILVISDNRFNDFSGLIAKKIMFHSDFNEHLQTVLSGGSSYVDDYSLNGLKQFKAVFLVEPKIHDGNKARSLLSQYEKSGGRVLRIQSKWVNYESLHERSGSIWTDKPAWNYSEEFSSKISEILKDLKSSNDNSIKIKKYTPEDLLFQVKTTSDNEILQFSDSFYPGWKASIDGNKTFVYMADGLVKAVVIPNKGEHFVRFYYEPDSFRKGALISLSTLLTLALLIALKLIGKINL